MIFQLSKERATEICPKRDRSWHHEFIQYEIIWADPGCLEIIGPSTVSKYGLFCKSIVKI